MGIGGQDVGTDPLAGQVSRRGGQAASDAARSSCADACAKRRASDFKTGYPAGRVPPFLGSRRSSLPWLMSCACARCRPRSPAPGPAQRSLQCIPKATMPPARCPRHSLAPCARAPGWAGRACWAGRLTRPQGLRSPCKGSTWFARAGSGLLSGAPAGQHLRRAHQTGESRVRTATRPVV